MPAALGDQGPEHRQHQPGVLNKDGCVGNTHTKNRTQRNFDQRQNKHQRQRQASEQCIE